MALVLMCAVATVEVAAMDDSGKVPVPTPRPSLLSAFTVPVPISKPSAVEKARFRIERILTDLPSEETRCRDRLEQLGVRFTPAAAVTGNGGCGIPHPVKVSRLPGGIALSSSTVLNCQATEALANWVREGVAPAARRIYGTELVGIDQYATYDCRTRNSQSGAKLSEHAKGSAIDIGRFVLADGTVVEVGFPAKGEDRRERFLKTVRDAGCEHFTTVLGPGSDTFHENHFHFDMAQRRSGYRYCR